MSSVDLREAYVPLQEDGKVASGRRAKGFTLGHSQSTVEWWKKRDSGELVAIKFKEGETRAVFHELKDQATRSLICSRAPNLVIIRAMVIDRELTRYGLVFEFIPEAKTLTSFIEQQEHGRGGTSEDVARTIFRQIMRAVKCMHNNGSIPPTPVLHRRIHPDNVLVTDNHAVHVINWNYAKKEQFSQPVTKCDRGDYIAPEMTRPERDERRIPYDQKVDVWSCGILLYRMVCRRLPFSDEPGITLKEFARKLHAGEVNFPGDISISPECRGLIKSMLEADPKKRLSSELVLKHEWVDRDSCAETENYGEQSGPSTSNEHRSIHSPAGDLRSDNEIARGRDDPDLRAMISCFNEDPNCFDIFSESPINSLLRVEELDVNDCPLN
jgi:serine/threonine protein kinase